MVMYEAALDAIANDTAWLFPQGSEDFQVAWRNVPRGWRKMSMRNVATLEDGRSADMIVAVDPSVDQAVGAIVEQALTLVAEHASLAAAEFNALPEAARRLRILQHEEALATLKAPIAIPESTRRALERSLIDSSLVIDQKRFLVTPR